MELKTLNTIKEELTTHLNKELLPFWTTRLWDNTYGGYITQWDENGEDSEVDEKSLLAHMRTIYSLSLAHQKGFDTDGHCLELAKKGVYFAIDHYWDNVYGGFYWLFNRKNEVLINQKIIYGMSFAIYALSTYTIASSDPIGLTYASKTFDLLQKYAAETSYGGYMEMFDRDWKLCEGGSKGGDRKTLDVHMHLMEAFTSLFICSKEEIHKRKLEEIITLLDKKILHPTYRTGIPQFYKDWSVAPQIKFDIIWGWDRFKGENGEKEHALENTSYGHNVEYFWLLLEALQTLTISPTIYDKTFHTILDHAVSYGIDWEYGGVYVEGSQDGLKVYDTAKEFWQQAEFLTGMLDAYLLYNDEKFLVGFRNVYNFTNRFMINHKVGEWLPLLERDGTPIWTHMSHSWKVNYHSIRAVVLTIGRLERVIEKLSN